MNREVQKENTGALLPRLGDLPPEKQDRLVDALFALPLHRLQPILLMGAMMGLLPKDVDHLAGSLKGRMYGV